MTDARLMGRRHYEKSIVSLCLAQGKIEPEVVRNVRSWQHSGIKVDQSVSPGRFTSSANIATTGRGCQLASASCYPLQDLRLDGGVTCEGNEQSGKARHDWLQTGRDCPMAFVEQCHGEQNCPWV